MKLLGWACVAAVAAFAVGIGTSPTVRDAVLSWGTMGSASQARLTYTDLEDNHRADALDVASIAWVAGPLPAAEPSSVATAEPAVVPAPRFHVSAPAPRSAWSHHNDVTDPYDDTTRLPRGHVGAEPVTQPEPESDPHFQPSDL